MTPVQPDTHKKFTEKHPQTLQKDTKSDPKDHQNGVKIALFGVQGVHWTLRGEDVSKLASKWCPGTPHGDPFGIRNRPWNAKKTLKMEKNTSLTRKPGNITKKYRNRTLPNLKKYGFVYTKRMFFKERVVKKKWRIWPQNDSKLDPKRSRGTLESEKKRFRRHYEKRRKKNIETRRSESTVGVKPGLAWKRKAPLVISWSLIHPSSY